MTARLVPRDSLESVSTWLEVTRSQPMSARPPPRPMRTLCRSSALSAILRWLQTAPPFWASPVMSITVAALPSRCAAMASSAPTVMTPVPPMPSIMME